MLFFILISLLQVYTIVNESKHLMVFGVPRINLHQEVKQLFGKYGEVAEVRLKTDELKPNNTGWFLLVSPLYSLTIFEIKT